MKHSYKQYLTALAVKRNTTPEALEEKYGDMIRDMWNEYATIEDGIRDLDADDAEYAAPKAELT